MTAVAPVGLQYAPSPGLSSLALGRRPFLLRRVHRYLDCQLGIAVMVAAATVNDFLVIAAASISATASAALDYLLGWQALNLLVVPGSAS